MVAGLCAYESQLSGRCSLNQEINLKGTYLLVHQFIRTIGGNGTFINLVSLGASFLAPGMSSYSPSQLAAIKFGEYVDLGNPPMSLTI